MQSKVLTSGKCLVGKGNNTSAITYRYVIITMTPFKVLRCNNPHQFVLLNLIGVDFLLCTFFAHHVEKKSLAK